MKRSRLAALVALVSLHSGACASVPLPSRVSASDAMLLAAAARMPKRAAIVGCAPETAAGAEPCAVAVRRVSEVLKECGMFTRVGGDPADADVAVLIHPLAQDDASDPPAHPMFVVASVFVPLWWSDRYGYRLSAHDRSGRRVEVDTRREGSEVMWSLAALLNLAPDRGFMPSAEREAAQVGVQLLPLWPGDLAPIDGGADERE